MEDNMKEFVAFSRKLLRVLIELRELLEEGEYEKVKSKLDGLIEDTQRSKRNQEAIMSERTCG